MNATKSTNANLAAVLRKQHSLANVFTRYRNAFRTVSCAMLAGALLSFSPQPASAQNGDFIRLNRDIGKCWHKQEAGMNNGNIIHLWDCDGGPVENRAFLYDFSTGFIRSSVNPSKCLHKKTGGFTAGDPLHLWDCDAGAAENKTFDYDSRDGRIQFRFNPQFCARTKFLGFDNGNPIVVFPCKVAETYTIARSRPASTTPPGGVPCSNVRLAPENLILEVKTGNLTGAGSSATIMIKLVFEDWETTLFTLNPDRSFFIDGTDVIDTGIQIPGGCSRKGTDIKALVIENRGSSGILSADAWRLQHICARSSASNNCFNGVDVNSWINGGGRLTMGR